MKNLFNTTKSPCYGSDHGNDYELYLGEDRKLIVRHGDWIDGLITGSEHDLKLAGGLGGGVSTLTLDEDEKLVEVLGKYDRYIGQLTFVTDKGRTLTYGEAGGGNNRQAFSIRSEEGKAIIGFFGKADNYLCSIGVVQADKNQVEQFFCNFPAFD